MTKTTDARKRSEKKELNVTDIVEFIQSGNKTINKTSEFFLGKEYNKGRKKTQKKVVQEASKKILENDK